MDLVVLATRNEGKARELTRLLEGTVKRVQTLRDHPEVTLPPETGSSYRENAFAKARAVNEVLGLPALGDDSGLEVDALDRGPGLYSARFAGVVLPGDTIVTSLWDEGDRVLVAATNKDRGTPVITNGVIHRSEREPQVSC